MLTTHRLRTLLFLITVPVLACQALSAASAQTLDPLQIMLSPALHPAAESVFVPSPDELPAVQPPAEWYARTGSRKGLSGQADTQAELFVAPDTAVLARGLSRVWPSVLAEHQEPAVLVQPGDVAGLSSSKELLIIPSGALANAGASDFFKAALAQYAADGGTIFCMTQRKGTDFSLLPLSEGQRLDAVGWSEDGGPLFRSSTAVGNHALVRELTRPAPLVETDGYLRTWPANAELLLVRPDGFPTLIVYPFGKGRVVVSTLFTDLASLLGSPEQDERLLLRSLLTWSKTHAAEHPAQAPADARPSSSGRSPRTPIAAPAAQLRSVHAGISRKADMVHVEVQLPGSAKLKDAPVLVRMAGQERTAALSRDKVLLSFDVPVKDGERRLSYAVYGKDGRSLARGSLVVPAADSKAVPERPFSFPGESAAIRFSNIGKGQVTIEALGFMTDQIISDDGTMITDVPHDLPAGSYPVQWLFETIQGDRKLASFPLDVGGYRVAVEEASVRTSRNGAKMTGRATFTVRAGRNVSGQLHLVLTRPDSSSVTVSEPVLTLIEGVQVVPVTFALDPDMAGMGELSYRFTTVLPAGAGLPTTPLTLDEGSVLFDAGESAVLAIVPQPLLQYEPGAFTVTALVVSKGSATVDAGLDGREFAQERKVRPGTEQFLFSLPRLTPGTHTILVALADSQGRAWREQRVVSGLRLPDLAITARTGEPEVRDDTPVIPIMIELGNPGKTASPPVRVVLFDGDPAQGRTIAALEVPALTPKDRASRTLAWPLFRNAGSHTLVAVVDPHGSVEDADRDNNRASLKVAIPDILLIAPPPPAAFLATDRITLPLYAFNLTGDRIQGLKLKARFVGPGGKTLSSDVLPVPELAPASRASLDQTLKVQAPAVGSYQLTASLTSPSANASAEVRFSVLPTLLFTGSLEGTPATAVQCRPFTVRTGVKSTGNVVHSAGTARLEVLAPGGTVPLLERTFTLAPGERSVKIESLDLPVGSFKLRFTGSARNDQFKISKQMNLAERDVTVTGPIEAKRLEGTFPRVLVLRGREGRVVEQAVGETMLQQAFEQDDIFLRMVDNADDFMAQAMTGKFNTYVLFEPQEVPAAGWLKERAAQGHGIIVAGATAAARKAGEDLGFTFQDLPGKKTRTISFTDRSTLGLTGTVPVSGKSLQVSGPHAVIAAHFGTPDQPAIVVDQFEKGRIVVLPLSLSRSAYEDGTLSIFSLVLRKAGMYAAPDADSGKVLSGGLALTSPAGAVKTRVIETLPQGSTVLWSNLNSSVSGTTITYAVKADREQRRLLYLYHPGDDAKAGSAEISHECGGRFVSQGNVE